MPQEQEVKLHTHLVTMKMSLGDLLGFLETLVSRQALLVRNCPITLACMTCMEMYGSGWEIVGMETILVHPTMKVLGLLVTVQCEFCGVALGAAIRRTCDPQPATGSTQIAGFTA